MLFSGMGVMVFRLHRTCSRQYGTYLSKRMVRLARSDWTSRVSIQLVTYLTIKQRHHCLNKIKFQKTEGVEVRDFRCAFVCLFVSVLRAPAKILWVDIKYSCPRHSSWSSSLQMRDLKEQAHGGGQTDPLVTGESQYLDSAEKKN